MYHKESEGADKLVGFERTLRRIQNEFLRARYIKEDLVYYYEFHFGLLHMAAIDKI